ncbi:MAG: hypothetical protein MHPSP_004531, partial [Paramarteilia canceri]
MTKNSFILTRNNISKSISSLPSLDFEKLKIAETVKSPRKTREKIISFLENRDPNEEMFNSLNAVVIEE